MKDQTNQLLQDFFYDLLGYEAEMEIDHKENEVHIQLELDPEQSGVVIGYRGEVLASIQLVLSLILQQHLEDWYPVRLNVNDYKEQRQKSLENLALNTADRVIETGSHFKLNNLSSYERRIVHATLSEHPEVTTFSEGDSPYRVLIIAPLED